MLAHREAFENCQYNEAWQLNFFCFLRLRRAIFATDRRAQLCSTGDDLSGLGISTCQIEQLSDQRTCRPRHDLFDRAGLQDFPGT